MSNLPLHGVDETQLPPEPQEAIDGLARALEDETRGRTDLANGLRAVVAAHPTFLDGWAHLAEDAHRRGDHVAAYAFARTGYHRGLDRIRKSGWKGQGAVPWSHEPNRGFLRSVYQLLRAATAIGEHDEAVRCRDFLLQLDPADSLDVRSMDLGS